MIGPLINCNQVEKLLRVVNDSVAAGARVVFQGSVEDNLMGPVVVADVKNDMPIAQTELFGPVVAIIPVDSEEEAIRIANASEYGLSGAVFTVRCSGEWPSPGRYIPGCSTSTTKVSMMNRISHLAGKRARASADATGDGRWRILRRSNGFLCSMSRGITRFPEPEKKALLDANTQRSAGKDRLYHRSVGSKRSLGASL